MQNVGQVKSFVDDLVMKLGTVSMRVALVLRSAEVQPLFQDLCIRLPSDNSPPPFNAKPSVTLPKASPTGGTEGRENPCHFCSKP